MFVAELRMLFRRLIVRIMLIGLFLIPVLIAVAVKLSGGPSAGRGPTFLDRASQNGVFVGLAALVVCVPFFIPVCVSVVTGESIAGEASLGTLRYLLTRPAGRSRLLAVKAATVGVFCLVGSLTVAIGGLLSGAVLFPLGSVYGLSGNQMSLSSGIGWTLLAAVVVGLSMLGLAALGVFISTLVPTPVGAMVLNICAVIAALICEGLSQLDVLHPWIFSDHWTAFTDLLANPVSWSDIRRDLLLQLGYVLVFGAASWGRFTSRDVTA